MALLPGAGDDHLVEEGCIVDVVRPVYIKALIAAIAVFVIGVCFALSDLYTKVGELKYEMIELTYGQGHPH